MSDNSISISTSLSNDRFVPYLNILSYINVSYMERAIVGKIIDLSDNYISVQKRDGRVLLVRRKAVLGVEPMKEEA